MAVLTDIDALRSLIAVVDRGSIAAASRHSGFSKAAISRQLTRLQGRMGLRLFERHGRGIRPLEVAVRLVDLVRVLVAQVDEFNSAAELLLTGSAVAQRAGSTSVPGLDAPRLGLHGHAPLGVGVSSAA